MMPSYFSKAILSFCILFCIQLNFLRAQDSAKGVVHISGKIKNATGKVFIIKGLGSKYRKELKIDSRGNFTDTLYTSPQNYVIFEGIHSAFIPFSPGEKVTIFADADDFPGSLVFYGDDAVMKNYLIRSDNLYIEENSDFNKKYSLSENDFLKFKDGWYKRKTRLLENTVGLPTSFYQNEKKNLYYGYLRDFIRYTKYHKRFDPEYRVSPEFESVFSGIGWENEKDYRNCHHYTHFVDDLIRFKFSKQHPEHKDDMVSLVNFINSNVKNRHIKDRVLYKIVNHHIEHANDIDALYHAYLLGADDKSLINSITETYKRLKKTSKGKIAPVFAAYTDRGGKKYALNNFRGTFLYINVWASWCPECIKEIPAFNKLYDQFKNKKIRFIGISVDPVSGRTSWEKTIDKYQLNGIQLFSDKSWDSDFIQAFSISGIPRYILIGPEGKIIDPNAPSPSDPELIRKLKELLR